MPSKKQRAKANQSTQKTERRKVKSTAKSANPMSDAWTSPNPNKQMIFCKEPVLDETREARMRGDLGAVFFHAQSNQPTFLLVEDFETKSWNENIKKWNEQVKDGVVEFPKCNMKDTPHTCEGREYWGLNYQVIDAVVPDPLSPMLFGWMCDGITYWFPNKEDRDETYEKIMK